LQKRKSFTIIIFIRTLFSINLNFLIELEIEKTFFVSFEMQF
jgi:hypothetical protein